MATKKCPTPGKQAYRTQQEAQKHVNNLYRKYGQSAWKHTYKCRCGMWEGKGKCTEGNASNGN